MNRLQLFPHKESPVLNTGRLRWLAVFVVLFLLQEGATSCGGPTITVENNTKFPVRVIVIVGGQGQVLSPSPGESSSADASAADASRGTYQASAVPDEDWINYAKTVRAYLNDQLAHSDQLSGPQLLNVVQRLKDIAAKMAQYEQAGTAGSSCAGTVSADHDGLVQVSIDTNGSLVLVCK